MANGPNWMIDCALTKNQWEAIPFFHIRSKVFWQQRLDKNSFKREAECNCYAHSNRTGEWRDEFPTCALVLAAISRQVMSPQVRYLRWTRAVAFSGSVLWHSSNTFTANCSNSLHRTETHGNIISMCSILRPLHNISSSYRNTFSMHNPSIPNSRKFLISSATESSVNTKVWFHFDATTGRFGHRWATIDLWLIQKRFVEFSRSLKTAIEAMLHCFPVGHMRLVSLSLKLNNQNRSFNYPTNCGLLWSCTYYPTLNNISHNQALINIMQHAGVSLTRGPITAAWKGFINSWDEYSKAYCLLELYCSSKSEL